GYGISPSSYLKKGNVVNIEGLTRSINDAVNQAETMANLKIEEAVVGLSLMNVDILRNKGVVAIPKSTSEITGQDVERVIQAAKILAISPDRDVVQVIPREFIVD
ncbi:MAG: cell division protein FtsA, partial [Thermovenabulum sp.]